MRLVRARGGGYKFRALRLNHGNFSWRSEHCTRKTRLVDVVYNAANHEYVRTKTLTKNAIVQIDATPFRTWYKNHYNIDLSGGTEEVLKEAEKKLAQKKREEFKKRREGQTLPKNIATQFKTGKLLAALAR